MANERKVYVVDTNVVLSDTKFYEKLDKDSLIIFPYTVIEELDKFKTDRGYLGFNARNVNKLINKISEGFKNNPDNISEVCDRKFSIRYLNNDFVSKGLNFSINDDKIIGVAIEYKLENPNDYVCVLSNDTVVRSKTLSLYNLCKVDSIEFDLDMSKDVQDFYKQFEYDVTGDILSKLYSGNKLIPIKEIDYNLTANTPLTLCCDDKRVLCRVDYKGENIFAINEKETYQNKMVKPLNEGQIHLASQIMDENIKIKAVIGRSGSGKSLISMAFALKMLDEGKVNKIKIIKPVSYIGELIGFLPNSLESKVAPIKASLYPIFDLLGRNLDQMEELGLIEFDIPLYERGKTYMSTFLIITEAQNLDSEIKALVTRLDDNSYAIVEGVTKQLL